MIVNVAIYASLSQCARISTFAQSHRCALFPITDSGLFWTSVCVPVPDGILIDVRTKGHAGVVFVYG